MQRLSGAASRHVSIDALTGCSTVLPGRPLRLALQVDSLDKGGLEQVVYNLVRSLHGEQFAVTLVICGDEVGYLGGLLLRDGYDVVAVNRDKVRFRDLLAARQIEIANLHYTIWGLDEYVARQLPVVYTVHNSYTWLSRREARDRKRAYDQVTAFVAVSSQVKGYFQQRFKVPAAAIQVIPNGIDVSDLAGAVAANRAEYGFGEDDFVFINVSSFIPAKCQGLMIAALQELVKTHPQARLLMVGNVLDGGYHSFVRRCISEAQLEKQVRIVDFVPRQELGRLLRSADCFLLPSLQEGWSNAIMEAMYFELPLILSDVGSSRDIITDSDIGIIIPNPYQQIVQLDSTAIERLAYARRPGNLSALLEAMAAMMDDAAGWRERSVQGKKRVVADLTVERMAQAYGSMFAQVVAG